MGVVELRTQATSRAALRKGERAPIAAQALAWPDPWPKPGAVLPVVEARRPETSRNSHHKSSERAKARAIPKGYLLVCLYHK